MARNRVYQPAEVCEMFHISKSTLYRWEREGKLPPVGRDLSGQRGYTQEHLEALAEMKFKQPLKEQFERVAEREADEQQQIDILENWSLAKFLYKNDVTGLDYLAECPRLSPETIRQLAQAALDRYEPRDKMFARIMHVVAEQSSKLITASQ